MTESTTDPFLTIWDEVLGGWRDLAAQMLEKLPESVRHEPQIQHEAGRLLLEAIASACLEAVAADGDHPVFLPALNEVLNIHQPNADTLYRRAVITPGGSYRLRGRVGSMRISRLGAMGTSPAKAGQIRAETFYDLHELTLGADGEFDLLLSPEKPDDYHGDWRELHPEANALLLRQMAYDWANERDAVISVERVDIPVARPRPEAAELSRRMRALVRQTMFKATLLLDHVEQVRSEGAVNGVFKEWDVVGGFGGLTGQFYYETVFDLAEDEALIIECDYPESHLYASLLLANEVFETIDWVNNHSSLNGSQWHVNSDGKLRVVVSQRDPGVQNWLDTAGYPTGIVQGRWTEASSTPMPSGRVVKVSEVLDELPDDTVRISPEQREQVLRDRRAAFQQRVHW
ncbi:hypothetical protein [Enemella sp. A6]|uniref:hypothetical protein n=1 Tax=Enemella sp. A6 TaxID=3440152 RepID=UPI003EC00432